MSVQQNNRTTNYATVSRILLFIGVVMLILSAFGVKFVSFNLADLGLALAFSSFLI